MRSSLPLSHKLFAVVIAVAAGCGLYTFLRYREAQLASAAALSFDSVEARVLDPGIMSAPNPALVLGQSILSDSAAAELAPKAGIAASSTAIAIGEFRARLELTQPVDGLLLVRYRDSDPAQAVDVANAVAEALATWAPSTAPQPAANAQPAPAPNPAPAPVPNPTRASDESQHTPPPGPSLAAALADLQAQLSSANQRVDTESSLQSGHDRQRYLESQVRDAQQKLGDLHRKFARSGASGSGQAGLEAIQHALTNFWPSAAGLNTAGTSGAQLRYEREQLTRDILIIEQQRKAALLAEAANSVPAAVPPQQTAPPAPQSQPASVPDVPSSPASGTAVNPLHLERTARMPAPIDWWPSAVVGCVCGLLYWGLVFASYHFRPQPDDFFDSYDESSPYGYSSFDNDPDAEEPQAPDTVQTSTRDAFRDTPHDTSVGPNRGQMNQTASSVNAVAPDRASEEPDDVFQGRNDESADPWSDKIRKNLSQTTVGRTFDTPNSREESDAPTGPARDASAPPSQTSRRRD